MNKFDPSSGLPGLAKLIYGDGEFRVVEAGTFVLCAVTGQKILLDDLRYWDVDLQEAYASPEAVLTRKKDLSSNQSGDAS